MDLKNKIRRSTWTERFAIAMTFVFCCILVRLTVWKESELFWLDLGGYADWQREALRTLYYPYLLFTLSATLILSWSAVCAFFRTFRLRRVWALLVLCWALFLGAIGLLFANNLTNFIEGRPVHYHDWDSVKQSFDRDLDV
ncbi:MAG: hypothetical protein ACI81V_000022 [Lentimonas sp.]|jgi:hypothetical protein